MHSLIIYCFLSYYVVVILQLGGWMTQIIKGPRDDSHGPFYFSWYIFVLFLHFNKDEVSISRYEVSISKPYVLQTYLKITLFPGFDI